MNNQLAQLQNWLGENNMDVAYISNPTNILYFTGFESDPAERVLALFVFADQDPFLFTPQLEVESAKKSWLETRRLRLSRSRRSIRNHRRSNQETECEPYTLGT